MSGSRICHLYTLSFPFGKGESFIEAELEYLSAQFEEVRIFPMKRDQVGIRALPINTSVVSLDDLGRFAAPYVERLKFALPEMGRLDYWKDIKRQWAHIGRMLQLAKALEEYLNFHPAVHHYSYWTGDWSMVLGICRNRGSVKRSISRAHGFDLYDERHSLGFQPYRRLQLGLQHRVFCISEIGKAAMLDQAPWADVYTSRLGTIDHGLAPISVSADFIHIVSCSAIIPLKRVELIAQVIAALPEAQWTHIGEGPVRPQLEQTIKELGIVGRTCLLGALDHNQVMEVYKREPFHLFLHLSETEGIPVSMMEAMSFGVPVFACDVGAVSEIVTTENGHLWAAEPDVQTWVADIRSLKSDMESKRRAARASWEERYSASKNYPSFVQSLLES